MCTRRDTLQFPISDTYLVSVGLVGLLRETGHPQDLCGLQETTERTLVHVHLAVINKLHQGV